VLGGVGGRGLAAAGNTHTANDIQIFVNALQYSTVQYRYWGPNLVGPCQGATAHWAKLRIELLKGPFCCSLLNRKSGCSCTVIDAFSAGVLLLMNLYHFLSLLLNE
jgi:hypothetical protein